MQSELNLRFRAEQSSPENIFGLSLDTESVSVDRVCRMRKESTSSTAPTRLCMSRRQGESVQLSVAGHRLAVVSIEEIKHKRVYISISASRDVLITRTELTVSSASPNLEGI